MATRAKFKCTQEQRFEGDYARTYTFTPVISNKPGDENKEFWDATPSGTITMHISNKKAWVFGPGKEYYVDFTAAGE